MSRCPTFFKFVCCVLIDADIIPTGYKEKGNIDTPLELAIRNQTDRFSLAMDAIDRIPHLVNRGASAREQLKNQQLAAAAEAFETGADPKWLSDWQWPHEGGLKDALAKMKLV